MTPRLGFFTFLSFALAALCFYLSPRPGGGVDLIVLVALALTLEFTAVRTPCFGFLSSAFAAYLATGLTQGAAAAAALVLVGVGGRALGRGGPGAGAILRESVADIFPALAALGMVALMASNSLDVWAGLGGGLIYLGATRVVPTLLAFEDEEFDLKELAAYGPVRLELSLGAVVTGVALALFLGRGLVEFLWTLPLFSVFHFVAAQALQVRETRRMAVIEREQKQDKRKLEQVKARLEENQDALAHKVEERVLMEELSHLFARSLEVQSVLNTTVEMVRRTLGCQTVAIFLDHGQGPIPVCYHSPHGDRLRDYSLLKLGEPVVEECHRRGLIIEARAEHLSRPRLLEGEAWAVALPIYQQGVLYLGDRRPVQVSKQQRHLLAIIADQASVALQAARNYQELQDALELHASANQELAAWNQRLDLLLNGSRALGSTLRRHLPPHGKAGGATWAPRSSCWRGKAMRARCARMCWRRSRRHMAPAALPWSRSMPRARR
ncbi:MAG: GAF domain-containing protein [Candidatus Eremiobacteraeota bacterium]|nr:GAF domain-containing protein [Candidatus Eremiobacteraeota bacterium]